MKAYGVPRNPDVESPDLVDIQTYGLKSSDSRVKGKCGDIKNSFRNTKNKAKARRIWKKRERQNSKVSVRDADNL